MEEIISGTVTDSEQVRPTFGDNDASGHDLIDKSHKDNQPAEKMDKGEVAHNNPYAYIDRADFTSEKFKIEIRGLPKFYGIGVRFPSLLCIKSNVFG
jgi:tRNA (uracil-5-)-methyltransferase